MRMARVTLFASNSHSVQCLLMSGLAFWALLLLGPAAPRAHGQAAASPAGAARMSAPAVQPARPAALTARKPGGRGMHEGIAVHGWWVIEVKRPDGKLLSHTEFENNLDLGGLGGALTNFFSQRNGSNPDGTSNTVYTPGEWGITLGDPTSPPCSANISQYAFNGTPSEPVASLLAYGGPFCVLTQLQPPAAIYPLNCGSGATVGCSYNLLAEDSNANLVLSGTVVSQSAGTISQVQTVISVCSGTVGPTACWKETAPDAQVNAAGGDWVGTFTAAPLPASSTTTTPCGGSGQISCAVTVPEAGDSINVTVTLSFQ